MHIIYGSAGKKSSVGWIPAPQTTFTIDTMKEFILWFALSFPAAMSPGDRG
jgi:hypothetical protein